MTTNSPISTKVLQRGLLLALSLGMWSCAASAAEPPATSAASVAGVDSACPWGRLGDGKGHLVRCLTETEAQRLLAESPPVTPAVAPPASATPVTKAPSLANVAPAEPPAAPAEPPPAEPPVTPPAEGLSAEISAVTADQGNLPDAMKSLKKALERFAQCVEKNGGLSAEKGEAELRFLVQGRGRAEGVSVKKRHGMSEPAAKCIADVVDRRYVGTPEEPMVGATLQVVISKKKR